MKLKQTHSNLRGQMPKILRQKKNFRTYNYYYIVFNAIHAGEV